MPTTPPLALLSRRLLVASVAVVAGGVALAVLVRLVPDATLHELAARLLPFLVPVAAVLELGAIATAVVVLVRGRGLSPRPSRRPEIVTIVVAGLLLLFIPVEVLGTLLLVSLVGAAVG